MSLRVDSSSLIVGALVCGHRGLGVFGADVPASGDNGAGYLYNDLSFPADNAKEVRGLIVTPPASGTLFAYESSAFDFTAAPDGGYSFSYRLFVDGLDMGLATAYLQVGPPAAAIAISTSSAIVAGGAVSGAAAALVIAADDALVSWGAAGSGAAAALFSASTASATVVGAAEGPPVTGMAITTAPAVFAGSASVFEGTLNQADLDYILAYLQAHLAIPTTEEIVAAVLAALSATTIPINVKAVNDCPITGTGVPPTYANQPSPINPGDPWRPL